MSAKKKKTAEAVPTVAVGDNREVEWAKRTTSLVKSAVQLPYNNPHLLEQAFEQNSAFDPSLPPSAITVASAYRGHLPFR